MKDQIPNTLAGAVNARALYPANHPRVVHSVDNRRAAVPGLFTFEVDGVRVLKRVCRDGPVFNMQEAVGW